MSKFYPLTNDEWVKAVQELNESEKDLLYYIRTLDPYSKGVEINSSAIAEIFGVNRSTVSRALKNLSRKQFIDLEILTCKVEIKGNGSLLHPRNPVASVQQSDVAPMHSVLHSCTPCCTDAQHVAPMQHDPTKSGSGHGADLSKINYINLDQLDQIDQESFFGFSESEKPETGLTSIAVATSKAILKTSDSKPIEIGKDTKSPVKTLAPIEVDSFRRRVEDHVLKTLNILPDDRKSYFGKFTAEHWQNWESKYKAQFSPSPVAHKIFTPEIVDATPPDSQIAKDALAQMRKKLGLKELEVTT